ncbi:VWA domain-containing protein [Paenibacillus lemnae]|uniref:VWA domain-containing protein n=1 Tax=Paenibacillus lemnae TaxID=1330551 RepID=A0A848M6K6_PAELE|nr:VWA domain-containing protein [Paenibacillus lemnae]NMO95810.1 VWA domain-containing protein [Paenibacillus lemnae]
MGIQSWLGLWFGLTLPAIILMYLFKRKYLDTTVSSHMLWDRVLKNLEANRPWQKLQNRLLLWLQLLAAALLVFALMQPFLRVSGSGSQHIVIVADTSGSMSAEAQKELQGGEPSGSGLTRLDLLKERILEYSGDEGKNSEITLLTVGARPVTLLSRENNRDAIRDALDTMQPYYGQASYRESLSLASALTREEQDAEVVIFTDGQWKEDPAQIAFEVPVRVETITGGTPVNHTVEQFGISGGNTEGGSVTAVAVISSNSKQAEPAEASLYGDGKLLASREIEVREGEKSTVTFTGMSYADVYRLELSGEDAYAPDNEAFAFGQSHGVSRVLLLTSGNFFLEKALQLSGAEVTRIQVDSNSEAAVTEGQEDQGTAFVPVPEGDFDLVVMDGPVPAAYQQGEWSKLTAQTPLWTLGTEEEKGGLATGRTVIENHPVTSYLSLSGVYIGSVADEKPSWGEAVVRIGNRPVIYAGKEGGYPRLSFGFRLQDSDLPLSSEFPVLVNNALQWMTSGSSTGLGRYTAGAAADIPITADTVKARWIPLEGLGKQAGYSPQEPIATDKGYSAVQHVPDVPGLYGFEQENQSGEKTTYWVAAAPDPFEGNLAESRGPGVSQNTGNAGGTSPNEEGSNQREADRSSNAVTSLIPWLALLALAVIAAEWGVYQRGRSI